MSTNNSSQSEAGAHFEELRERIRRRLVESNAPQAALQIERYPWLYGALGSVPARVAFICENPSLAGVETAHVHTIDGGPPDIDAQWWGGPRDDAAVRFRVVLHELGLKTTPPAARGGWQCYITNVIKAADVAKDHAALSFGEKVDRAREWADVLAWELHQVEPAVVLCVGGSANDLVRAMQRERRLPRLHTRRIIHYSARGRHDDIREKMRDGIATALAETRIAAV